MIKLEPNAIHGPMKSVFSVEQRISFRSQDGQVLDVSPGQLRTRNENSYSLEDEVITVSEENF